MDDVAPAARPAPQAPAAPGLIAGRERASGGRTPADHAPGDSERPTWPAMRRGLALRCPACGQGHLFEGYLKVADHCPACGAEMRHHRADDGPAYLTILIVGHILGFLMHFIWVQFRPEPLLFATMLTVVAVGLSLFMLPRVKGAIVGLQWARRMHGFGAEPHEGP